MAKIQAFKKGELLAELDLDPGQTYFVGRKENCDIVLDKLPGISRQHFKISESAGAWRVDCISGMRGLDYDGQEVQNVALSSGKRFYLAPYSFAFFSDVNQAVDEDGEPPKTTSDGLASPADNSLVEFDPPSFGSTPQVGSEEQTAVKSFKGIPYIKLSAGHGRKPEYFRLEGHLWVAGSDGNAAIYLSDSDAAPAHFEIAKSEKGFFITDLGSAGGTQLNGQRLAPNVRTDLASGDLIGVGGLALHFELRDQTFKEKINNIPLHMYQNPLVFFDQEAGVLETIPDGYNMGEAEEIAGGIPTSKPADKKKFIIRFAAVVVVLLGLLSWLDTSKESNEGPVVQNLSTFDKLPEKQKKFVTSQYDLAKNLYLNGNFELSLMQIQKLHEVIPEGYEDSKRMEEYCINSRETKQQLKLMEEQRRKQAEDARIVEENISHCEVEYGQSVDLDSARACLSTAVQMDPSNARIQDLLVRIQAKIEQQIITEKLAQEAEEKARRGKNLYLKAKTLHQNKQYIQAMEAYENHIYSGLPDPEGLVKSSKRHLASIEKYIDTKKSRLMASARLQFNTANLKEAIELARKALEVDPHDFKISYFLHKSEQELESKMKNLYMDSVIEERFGNIDASRAKWEEIIRFDVEDGEYYLKAKRKMKQYGF